MTIKLIVAAAAAALGSLCLAQTPTPQGAAAPPGAQTTWRLATGYRAESFHTQNIMQFSRDVEQATAGKLVIQVHPNNTLAKLNEVSQAVQQGKHDSRPLNWREQKRFVYEVVYSSIHGHQSSSTPRGKGHSRHTYP